MKSHEFARLLLALEDRELVLVVGGDDKGGTIDKGLSQPWESGVGDVRVSPRELETKGGFLMLYRTSKAAYLMI